MTGPRQPLPPASRGLVAALVGLSLLVVTQAGSIEGLFGVVVFTVLVALPWTVLTLALGAVVYLAGRPASSRSDERTADTLPFGAGDG